MNGGTRAQKFTGNTDDSPVFRNPIATGIRQVRERASAHERATAPEQSDESFRAGPRRAPPDQADAIPIPRAAAQGIDGTYVSANNCPHTPGWPTRHLRE